MRGEVVLVLHGLFRTRGSMADMCDYLREHTDMEVIDLGYPSTRESVGQHAQTLARAVESLKGVERVHFVAHSLGNLVIRHYLNDRSAVAATEGLPPLGRLVMLAPPNQQPILATRLARLDVTRQVGGPALVELSTGWADLAPRLATPRIEFGVLAGGPGGLPFRNPLVPGESDLVVTVESTRLVGARDFRVVPTEHTFIMDDPTVQRLTAEFLKFGHFENEDARRPIVEEVVETPAAVGQGP
jgi:pimeloyl-ACP methyl ester carboxylesterase